MKFFLFLWVALFMTACSSSEIRIWDKLGVEFKYPSYLIAMEKDDSVFYSISDITVSKTNVEKLSRMCGDYWNWDDTIESQIKSDEIYKDYLFGIKSLMKDGLDNYNYSDIAYIEAISCGAAAGNRLLTPIKVSGYNGFVAQKYFGQECCNIESYKTELFVVDDYGDIFIIWFEYDWGEMYAYSTDHNKDLNYLFDWKDEVDQELEAFFVEGTVIETGWLKPMVDNKRVIDEIIDTVKISG